MRDHVYNVLREAFASDQVRDGEPNKRNMFARLDRINITISCNKRKRESSVIRVNYGRDYRLYKYKKKCLYK